jgi:hypothetical protein
MKNLNLLFILIVFIISCKTNSTQKTIDKFILNKDDYNKFDDRYSKYKYINKSLNMTMDFDSEWIIITDYQNFDDFQKKFARYFSTAYSEVLFLGFNDKKNIGLRATVEILGLSNKDYVDKIKATNILDQNNYNITIINDKEINLKNIQAYSLIYEIKLNENNYFIFDTIIFKDNKNNFRIDIWVNKKNYEKQKDYIQSLFQTIDIIEMNDDKVKDETMDTKKQ